MSEPNAEGLLSKKEYDRMWGVLDMLLSAHSYLRDRYRRRQTGLALVIIVLSIVATAMAFLSGEKRTEIGSLDIPVSSIIGILTAVVFFLALFDLTVDWRRQTWAHDDAARRLSELKGRFRSASVSGDTVDSAGLDLKMEYDRVMATVNEIPERLFLAMKAKHHRKVEVSKLISSHPGAPLPLLRLSAMREGLRGGESPNASEQGSEEQPRDTGLAESVEEPPA
jgi:hypothetical protein